MSSFGLEIAKEQIAQHNLNEGQKKRIQPLWDLFNLLAINFIPTALLASHICKKKSPHFFDSRGQNTDNKDKAVGIRAYFGPNLKERHIVIDTLKATSTSKAKIKASGFKYDCAFPKTFKEEKELSGDELKAQRYAFAKFNKAVDERCYAAIQMVGQAKAMGWKNVNFLDTEDPVEKHILALACESAGLNHSENIDIPAQGTAAYGIYAQIKETFDKRDEKLNESILMPENNDLKPEKDLNPGSPDTLDNEEPDINPIAAFISDNDQIGSSAPRPV